MSQTRQQRCGTPHYERRRPPLQMYSANKKSHIDVVNAPPAILLFASPVASLPTLPLLLFSDFVRTHAPQHNSRLRCPASARRSRRDFLRPGRTTHINLTSTFFIDEETGEESIQSTKNVPPSSARAANPPSSRSSSSPATTAEAQSKSCLLPQIRRLHKEALKRPAPATKPPTSIPPRACSSAPRRRRAPPGFTGERRKHQSPQCPRRPDGGVSKTVFPPPGLTPIPAIPFTIRTCGPAVGISNSPSDTTHHPAFS